MKIYTKTGDAGKTSLINGQRVVKYHPQIEAYGTADSLNSFLGLFVSSLKQETNNEDLECYKQLHRIQNLLFDIGSALASQSEEEIKKYCKLKEEDIAALENKIDEYTETLPPLKNFILPGGSMASAHAHICRTKTRELERRVWELDKAEYDLITRFLNRLSDYFFVLARMCNHWTKNEELVWK